jgi:hypothetical protein
VGTFTKINWLLPSMPDATRTTAPASLTSITDSTEVTPDPAGAAPVSVMIGTNVGIDDPAGSVGSAKSAIKGERSAGTLLSS